MARHGKRMLALPEYNADECRHARKHRCELMRNKREKRILLLRKSHSSFQIHNDEFLERQQMFRQRRKLRYNMLRARRQQRDMFEKSVRAPNNQMHEQGESSRVEHTECMNVENLNPENRESLGPEQEGFISMKQMFRERHQIGQRYVRCHFCGAHMWIEERMSKTSKTDPGFLLCCQDGLVNLPYLPKPPLILEDLLSGMYDSPQSKFLELFRTYNAMFQFTSTGGLIDYSVQDGRGPYCYRISGENYHIIGSLMPVQGLPKFAQLYIYDTHNEVDNRMNNFQRSRGNNDISRDVVVKLKEMLDEVNPYVQIYRHARDIFNADQTGEFHIRLLGGRRSDARQYNLPTSNEVAALMVGDGSEDVKGRDIIIKKKIGKLERIFETYACYMPLQYPLLFPFGEEGWRPGIEYRNGQRCRRREQVSIREFYAFRLQYRDQERSILLQSGRLFQQFVVDAYAAIESQRLLWIKINQKKLRIELYEGLQDAITAGETVAGAVGRRIVLPSSFHGGPRDMYQNYQDTVAICRWAGPPDFFITFTCNPKWPDITEALKEFPGQKPEDRPDIVARVFNLKFRELMNDIKHRKIFGKVVADIHVIEFQKRGLPHAHILIKVDENDRPKTVEDIDAIIRAELPSKKHHPLAYKTVLRSMIHGPCGNKNPSSPCMVNGICSKRYPKSFAGNSTIDANGYVLYRRRNCGEIPLDEKQDSIRIDNRWVVPYNLDLVTKYDAHINVEICAKPELLKYLYKYVHKGHDRSTIAIEDNSNQEGSADNIRYKTVDEVQRYLDCRYVSSIEACWRIFEFSLHAHHPSVERLQYHLPNQQSVTFNDGDELHDIVSRPGITCTMLTAWFEANRLYNDARTLTYAEFPEKWVWNGRTKAWTKREKGFSIGRLYYTPPTSGERYYLRMLLHLVRGATSFEELRTVDGIVHPTFKAACNALGLLDDDNEWHDALNEASTWATAFQMRNLFCSMLMFNQLANPGELWDRHSEQLSEDILIKIRREYNDHSIELSSEELRNFALMEIESILNNNGRSLSEFQSIPMPVRNDRDFIIDKIIREELNYDPVESLAEYQRLYEDLNAEQAFTFDAIVKSVTDQKGGLFFVYGSGGTGKTYLWRTLIARLRSEKKIVISVASSGIAALLLPGGRTAHSRFKIPLTLNENSTCSIAHQSPLSKLIQKADLIIWDEAPMLHRNAFEAVDRTLRDLMKYHDSCAEYKVFGCKTVVLGGDFRQILPVVPKGGREIIVSSSLQRSNIWQECQVFRLTTNMRILAQSAGSHHSEDLKEFADWILDVGEGRVNGVQMKDNNNETWIRIPEEMLIQSDGNGLRCLIDNIYPDIAVNYVNSSYLQERCILAPKHEDVDIINSIMLSLIPGDVTTYLSADSIDHTDDGKGEDHMNPPELLHSIKLSGLPNHRLQLKEGCPVMLLRNLNQTLGLCNGTRLIVIKTGKRVIEAKVITGSHFGEIVLIPRVNMSPTQTDWPFVLRRKQFPLKLAFAMTINKSQGQTLQHVGLYLPKPVFTHGQLYVALSRCTSRSNLKILLSEQSDYPTGHTKNIVYREVLDEVNAKEHT